MDKLKLRFCVGWYSKIKLWRACVSPCFVISMRKLLGPFIFMFRLTICHHFTHSCLHWKPIFDNILQLFRPSFSSTQKIEKSDCSWNLVEGTLDTSKVRGEPFIYITCPHLYHISRSNISRYQESNLSTYQHLNKIHQNHCPGVPRS